MNPNNPESDGRMTLAQRERLEEWHTRQIDELFDELLENDPAFRTSMDALTEADKWDISKLAYDVAGDVASWAADGFSEAEWFEELYSNQFMQLSFSTNGIRQSDILAELSGAIETLKIIGLWPWA
ncbi:MAG: hypothetical protein J0I20_30390 [Chloroflexi bacterium]|nr:hypothetical protein [Chloroflexota bacterium]OJV92965.1 MAG: hypothetical protein BGO39_03345 [Chloroflexi bacterium 54-19]